MRERVLKSDALLLLAALIWGFAFVPQRVGMEHLGPFTFNALRFAMGALVLAGPVLARRRRGAKGPSMRGGLLLGLVLFCGAAFQQSGLVTTTAGKAGFITGLYVVFVPLLGRLIGQRTGLGTWAGALLAALGLYLLSGMRGLAMARGDFLVLCGALCWATHVLLVDRLARRGDPLALAVFQFVVCALLSGAVAGASESFTPADLRAAAPSLLYAGFLSVGIAYTLQIVAQREAPPAHAAIILSLETVFAALGGWLVLGEILSPVALTGCGLMLAGMLLSQLWRRGRAVPLQA